MTLIYLVRHGETKWNQEQIFRGRKDIPLSDQGRMEALSLAQALSREPIQFLYSSPLQRALETAQPISEKFKLSVEILPGMIDLDFGDWEGKSSKEIAESDPELFQKWARTPENVFFPKGEGLRAAKERAISALKEVVAAHPDQCGVVVSHRVICKLVILAAIGSSEAAFWRVQQDLACYNLLEWTGRDWLVRLVNETGHLKEIAVHLKNDF